MSSSIFREYCIAKESIDGTVMWWSVNERWSANKRKRGKYHNQFDAMEVAANVWTGKGYIIRVEDDRGIVVWTRQVL